MWFLGSRRLGSAESALKKQLAMSMRNVEMLVSVVMLALMKLSVNTIGSMGTGNGSRLS